VTCHRFAAAAHALCRESLKARYDQSADRSAHSKPGHYGTLTRFGSRNNFWNTSAARLALLTLLQGDLKRSHEWMTEARCGRRCFGRS